MYELNYVPYLPALLPSLCRKGLLLGAEQGVVLRGDGYKGIRPAREDIDDWEFRLCAYIG
jgi:hypothetical protein